MCVCVSGWANCTLPCAYVGTSLSCVSKCVLSPGAVSSCVKDRLIFFFTSFLLFVCLRKVINHTAPAGEGSCGSGPTLPPWGTSLESYNLFLDPHFSVCGKPKKEGTPNLSYFMDALSTSRWCDCCHAGLGEERSLTNLDWWAS